MVIECRLIGLDMRELWGNHNRDINAAKNLKRLATETALPVTSNSAMKDASDMPMAVYGGKVTPVRYDIRNQMVSGQEEKKAVLIILDNHICAPFQ